MTLDLTDSKFSAEEEENLPDLFKHENIENIILEGTNLARESI